MSSLLQRLELYLNDDITSSSSSSSSSAAVSSTLSSADSTSSLLPEGLLEVVLKGGVWAYEEDSDINEESDDLANWSKLIDSLRNQILFDAIDAHKEDLADDEAFFELAKQLRDILSMTYDIFIQKAAEAPTTLQKFFKPSIFLMFPRLLSLSLS
jgi:hypothetical protein